jgi:thymidine kinase
MEPLRSQSRLDILFGSMMSGKSSALLRNLTQLSDMGLSALYINHGVDDRAKTMYSTHSTLLQNQNLNISATKTSNLLELSIDVLIQFDVIGIDEAQFFDDTLVPFVQNLVDVHKKYVIVVGLDGNFRREKFGHILDLIPIADNVTKLHAYCKRCAEHKKTLVNASFTHYVQGSCDGDTVIVGGAEKYIALCRDCYLELYKEN